ncbi:MAG: JAB domain-containing protein [bacterium]|nr:JAB domain-containing protein [bacterium]
MKANELKKSHNQQPRYNQLEIDHTILKEMEIRYKESPELPQTDDPMKVSDFTRKLIGNCADERFIVLYVDYNCRVYGYSFVAQGSINEAVTHPREIFKGAIMSNAFAIISCHNHPGGDMEPSEEDILITKRLEEVGDLVGIALVDHLIVGEEGCFSLKEGDFLV